MRASLLKEVMREVKLDHGHRIQGEGTASAEALSGAGLLLRIRHSSLGL